MFDSLPMFRRAGLAAATISVAGLLFSGCDHHADFIGHARRAAQVAQQRGRRDAGKLYQASPQSGVGGARQGRADIPGRAERQLHHRRRARQGRAARGRRQCRLLQHRRLDRLPGRRAVKAMVLLFMTQGALDKFRNNSGWTVGADATVAVVDIGANGRIDTNGAAAGGERDDEQWRADGRCVAGRHEDIQDRRTVILDRRHGRRTARAVRRSRLFAGRFRVAASPPWRTACARARSRRLRFQDPGRAAGAARDSSSSPSQQAVARDLGFAGGELHFEISLAVGQRAGQFRAWCAPWVALGNGACRQRAPCAFIAGAWRHPASRAAYGFARVLASGTAVV